MKTRSLARAHASWMLSLILCFFLLLGCSPTADLSLLPDGGDPNTKSRLSLDDVAPHFALSQGGSILTLRGTGFSETAKVTIDGKTCPKLWFHSAQELAVEVPPSPGRQGLVPIEIRNDSVTAIRRSDLFGFQSTALMLRRQHTTGARPTALLLADINGDTRVDLVTANGNGNSLSILTGRGDGRFSDAHDVAVDSQPQAVAAADVNQDGRIDLVSASQVGNSVSITLWTANGFWTAQRITIPNGPCLLAVNDLNGDGREDILVVTCTQAAATVLLSQGGGRFAPPQAFTINSPAGGLLVRDLNRDGKLDMITTVPSQDRIDVRLGVGDGSFGSVRSFAVGHSPQALVAADFNDDGKLDVVVSNHDSSDFSTLLGNGDGTFKTERRDTFGGPALALTVADIDQDGATDIVATFASELASSEARVYRGLKDGSFTYWVSQSVDTEPRAIAAADLNGDGQTDVVTIAAQQDSATVLLGHPVDGLAKDERDIDCPNLDGRVAVGDLDADGKLDVICPDASNQSLLLLSGRGDGTFLPTSSLRVTGEPNSVLLWDNNPNYGSAPKRLHWRRREWS